MILFGISSGLETRGGSSPRFHPATCGACNFDQFSKARVLIYGCAFPFTTSAMGISSPDASFTGAEKIQ